MRRLLLSAPFVLLLASLTTGCPKKEEPPPGGEPVASAASSAPAAGSAAPVAAGDPCTVESQNAWGKGANGRTGITLTRGSEGRVALGVAFGNRPEVLVLDKDGKGTLLKIPLKDGSEIAKSIPASEGRRDLQRVTPYWEGGEIRALVDYRDKYENKHRRIACGPSGNDDPALLFDGVSRFKGDEEKPAKKKTEPPKTAEKPGATPAAAADGGVKVAAKHTTLRLPPGARHAKAGATPAATSAAPPATTATPPPGMTADASPTKLHELRDCRSFVDPVSGTAWGVGSELIGEPGEGDDIKWSMSLFTRHAGSKQTLYAATLDKNAKAAFTLEAPVGARFGDAWVLTGRYQGSLLGWVLDSGMHKRGSTRTYRAQPGLVRMAENGEELLMLVAQSRGQDRWALRAARVEKDSKQMPVSLLELAIEGSDPSLAEPSFARAGSQGWLLYHAGPRRKARLSLMPVNAELASAGHVHEITGSGESVYESQVLALDAERLLVVYILNHDSGASELVSQVLRCKA